MRYFFLFATVFLVGGCVGLPQGVHPVSRFELNRYLGTWYEIARLDHSFERGLQRVTAEYFLRDDGGLRVINKGYVVAEQTWKEAEGKAYFVGPPDQAHLKVSFFGPFYGAYIVFELDRENYQYAFVASYNTSYLWLLSRTPQVSDELVQRFTRRAAELGYATENLIYVEHEQPD